MAEHEGMEAISVRGVTLKEDLAFVELVGVPNHRGLAARIFAVLGQHNILVDDIVQNIDEGGAVATLGFAINAHDLKETQSVCDKLKDEVGFRAVGIDEGVSKVSAIGVGMRSHTGVAARMFAALSDAEINIENIATGEIVISCIVRREDGQRALQALHDTFDLGGADHSASAS